MIPLPPTSTSRCFLLDSLSVDLGDADDADDAVFSSNLMSTMICGHCSAVDSDSFDTVFVEADAFEHSDPTLFSTDVSTCGIVVILVAV